MYCISIRLHLSRFRSQLLAHADLKGVVFRGGRGKRDVPPPFSAQVQRPPPKKRKKIRDKNGGEKVEKRGPGRSKMFFIFL